MAIRLLLAQRYLQFKPNLANPKIKHLAQNLQLSQRLEAHQKLRPLKTKLLLLVTNPQLLQAKPQLLKLNTKIIIIKLNPKRKSLLFIPHTQRITPKRSILKTIAAVAAALKNRLPSSTTSTRVTQMPSLPDHTLPDHTLPDHTLPRSEMIIDDLLRIIKSIMSCSAVLVLLVHLEKYFIACLLLLRRLYSLQNTLPHSLFRRCLLTTALHSYTRRRFFFILLPRVITRKYLSGSLHFVSYLLFLFGLIFFLFLI